MPLFKKKKPAPTSKEIVEGLEKDISNAAGLTDPGSRFLAFSGLEETIKTLKNSINSPEFYSGEIKRISISAGIGGAMATGIFFIVPPMGIMLGSVVALCSTATIGHDAAALLKIRKDGRLSGLEIHPALDGLLQKLSSKKEEIVRNNLLDLRSSPHFSEICGRFPNVASAFALAAAETGIDVPRIVRLDKTDNNPSAPG